MAKPTLLSLRRLAISIAGAIQPHSLPLEFLRNQK
jgi:hypothetical protein